MVRPSSFENRLSSSFEPLAARKNVTDQFYEDRFKRYSTIVELLFQQHELKSILAKLIGLMEAISDDMLGSVLLLSEDGKHLLTGAAPSLAKDYCQAIHGVAIGEAVGSCGTAAYLQERVIVENIATHPYWADYKDLALASGLQACWSEPIWGSGKRLLGTFAMYYPQPKSPTDLDIQLIEEAAVLAGMAIERRRDIEHQKMTEALIDRLPSGVAITDANGILTSINQSLSSVTGFDAPELMGNTIDKVLGIDQGTFNFQELCSTLDSNKHYSGEHRATRSKGTIYYIALQLVVLRGPHNEIKQCIYIISDITERKSHESLIQRQANYDQLTQLPNRNYFYQRTEWTIQHCQRESKPGALILIDLDYFKEVNDRAGHSAGDSLLIEIALRLQTHSRQSDTLARLGGDEFAMFIYDQGDPAQLLNIAEKFLTAVSEPCNVETIGNQVITGSLGIARFPEDGIDATSLLQAADQAMYSAKNSGGNRARLLFQRYAPEGGTSG